MDIDGSDKQADGSVVNRRRQVENMLLSKTPIMASRNHLLPKLAILDYPNDQRVALEGIVDSWVQSGSDIASNITCPKDSGNDTFHDCRLVYGFVSSNDRRSYAHCMDR